MTTEKIQRFSITKLLFPVWQGKEDENVILLALLWMSGYAYAYIYVDFFRFFGGQIADSKKIQNK